MARTNSLRWQGNTAECVVPLVGVRGTDAYASGTAFFVTQHLAVTAAHVLSDFAVRFCGKEPDFTGIANLDFDIHGLRRLPTGTLSYRAVQSWFTVPGDVAVLEFEPLVVGQTSRLWPVVTLEAFPPAVDTPIVAFGYRRQSVSVASSQGRVTATLTRSHGIVQEIHPEHRDQSRLRFPCFRTDAQFDGGMSGGPVFNQDGRVCGIVCSSIPATSPKDAHSSYAASVWPLFGVIVDHPPGPGPRQRATLLQLVERGVLAAHGAEHVRVHSLQQGIHLVDLLDENGRVLDSLTPAP